MSGGEKGNQYQTQDACADTLDVMNKRLSQVCINVIVIVIIHQTRSDTKQDLRQRIRRLVYSPVLTAEWREVTELISHLSQVATMESKDVVKREGSGMCL